MVVGTDRTSTVRAFVRGESAITFETALQGVRAAKEGQISPISVRYVNQALNTVNETVFPHCVLETQGRSMNRKMQPESQKY
jgi:hypothetical protein